MTVTSLTGDCDLGHKTSKGLTSLHKGTGLSWIMSNPRGRPKKRELVVSPEQKIALRQLLQQPRSSRSLAFRARIVLECASGESNAAVAAKLRTTGFTVGMWRNRFITEGIVGLGDEMRPGAPRQIGDDRVERAVRLTLEEAPKGVVSCAMSFWTR